VINTVGCGRYRFCLGTYSRLSASISVIKPVEVAHFSARRLLLFTGFASLLVEGDRGGAVAFG
jgi:hypothetical protein